VEHEFSPEVVRRYNAKQKITEDERRQIKELSDLFQIEFKTH
jgi:hypothetical protein